MNNQPSSPKTTNQSKPAESQLSSALSRALAVYLAWKVTGLLDEEKPPESQSEK